MDAEQIKARALADLQAEDFKRRVEQHKQKLKAGKWWHRIFPFRIKLTIERR